NVGLNGLVMWEDYNVFATIFQSTAKALCFVKRPLNFFMTMSHLVFSFVLIISQSPVSGFSALIGYGGRCTARTVPKETKKNSPIIIATNASFITMGGSGFLNLLLRKRLNEVLKKTEWRSSLFSSSSTRKVED